MMNIQAICSIPRSEGTPERWGVSFDQINHKLRDFQLQNLLCQVSVKTQILNFDYQGI